MFARFIKDESGATAIEYGLLAALLALGLTFAITGLEDAISDMFGVSETKLGTIKVPTS